MDKFAKAGRQFDVVFSDLTDVPLVREREKESCEFWSLMRRALEMGLKAVKPGGQFLTHVSCRFPYLELVLSFLSARWPERIRRDHGVRKNPKRLAITSVEIRTSRSDGAEFPRDLDVLSHLDRIGAILDFLL